MTETTQYIACISNDFAIYGRNAEFCSSLFLFCPLRKLYSIRKNQSFASVTARFFS
jgi:hypothetical protein